MKKEFLLCCLLLLFCSCKNDTVRLNNAFEIGNNVPTHSLTLLLHNHEAELYRKWNEISQKTIGKSLLDLYMPKKSYCVLMNDSCLYNNENFTLQRYGHKIKYDDIIRLCKQAFVVADKPFEPFFILIDKGSKVDKPVIIQLKHKIRSIEEIIEEHIENYDTINKIPNYQPNLFDANGEHLCNIYRTKSLLAFSITFAHNNTTIKESIISEGELWTPYKFSINTNFEDLVKSKPILEQSIMYPK